LTGDFRGIFAHSPKEFEKFAPYQHRLSESYYSKDGMLGYEFSWTNKGVCFKEVDIWANVNDGYWILPIRS